MPQKMENSLEIKTDRKKLNSRKILKIAQSWIGTKFHYGGRIRKNAHNAGGVDCIGLILGIGAEIDSRYGGKNIACYDYLTYSRYPNFGEMKNFLDKYFAKITEKQLKIGDLIYFNFPNGLEHVALKSSAGIIHCYVEARCVVEHSLNDYWSEKIVGFYRYPLC